MVLFAITGFHEKEKKEEKEEAVKQVGYRGRRERETEKSLRGFKDYANSCKIIKETIRTVNGLLFYFILFFLRNSSINVLILLASHSIIAIKLI